MPIKNRKDGTFSMSRPITKRDIEERILTEKRTKKNMNAFDLMFGKEKKKNE